MSTRAVLSAGIVMLLTGSALGYGITLLTYPNVNYPPEYQALKTENLRFRTWHTCIPTTHEEVELTPDTWVHYSYDEEHRLILIEIETIQPQTSPSWAHLPQGHPGMEFEHWALHVWFQNPEDACLDLDGLIERLRAEGLTVELGGEVSQAFFSVKGRSISVNGGAIQVYEYGDLPSAIRESALVSPDGWTVGNYKVSWISTPHFYLVGKMIVIYLGDDRELKLAVEGIVGYQFAGG